VGDVGGGGGEGADGTSPPPASSVSTVVMLDPSIPLGSKPSSIPNHSSSRKNSVREEV
jgi:hypothetical protein